MNHTAKFLFILFLFSTCSIVNAQERVQTRVNPVHKGQLGVGVKGGGLVTFYGGALPLIGFFTNYCVSDRLRLEADLDVIPFWGPRGGLAANYLFPINHKFTFYPILEVGCVAYHSSTDRSNRGLNFEFDMNVGGGGQYHMGRNISLGLDAKVPIKWVNNYSYLTLNLQFSRDLLAKKK